MIKRISLTTALIATAFTLGACSEVPQGVVAAKKGDEKAALIYEAMAYQVAKDIGASVAVLSCDVDAIILTGGIAYSEMMTGWIKDRVSKMAEVVIYPGEDEMIALAEGALRVLNKEEEAKEYV